MKTPQMKIQSIDTRAVDLLLIRPRLKRGAIVLSLSDSLIEGNRVFVGCNGSGIQCEALGIRTIIAAFDGKKSAQEIAEALAIDSEIVSQVVGQLLSAGLIDYLVTQIVAPGRFKEQDQSSDAFVFNSLKEPIKDNHGNFIRRPAGHGALLPNLQSIDSSIIFIKNIDFIGI